MSISLVALLAGVVAIAPSWWWHHVVAIVLNAGRYWLPVLLISVGVAGLGWRTQRRWRKGAAIRQRPIAERVPLFVHVTILLLLAVGVAMAAGAGIWEVLGRPDLGRVSTGASNTRALPGWTVQNTFDAIKIVLAIVAGIGGVVALTVAYRKQDHGEAAEHRENTKLFNERFGKAADQLGSDKAAVRLAGVYAMAGLADDWEEGRQNCIDVLCAYLRMPYTPPADDTPTDTAAPAAGLSNRLIRHATKVLAGRRDAPHASEEATQQAERRQERQVRHTILKIIGEHLRLPGHQDFRPRWHGHRFYFGGAVIDGGNLSRIVVTDGTVLDFTAAVFPGGKLSFEHVRFSGGTVYFGGARFSGGTVTFNLANFSGSRVSFDAATFPSGEVSFEGATFAGSEVSFGGATFSGSDVWFSAASFSAGLVLFGEATFSGGKVYFGSARFTGGALHFTLASFCGGRVDFTVATFSGSEVNFAEPQSWEIPPRRITGSEPGVRWPSPQHLARLTKN